MRRSLIGLLTVVAIAGLLITTGCERSNVLRVVQLNRGNSLQSDVADFFTYFDKVDSEWISVYQAAPDSIEVELQYVEIGAGLPTWTPYQASINRITVTYKSADPTITYDNAIIPMFMSVVADREGKKTRKFTTTVVPAWWKEKTFGDDVVEPPDYDLLDVVDATIKFSGYDSVSGRAVEASGKLSIEFGNFYDDPTSFGK
jgi:hypothetical protein